MQLHPKVDHCTLGTDWALSVLFVDKQQSHRQLHSSSTVGYSFLPSILIALNQRSRFSFKKTERTSGYVTVDLDGMR